MLSNVCSSCCSRSVLTACHKEIVLSSYRLPQGSRSYFPLPLSGPCRLGGTTFAKRLAASRYDKHWGLTTGSSSSAGFPLLMLRYVMRPFFRSKGESSTVTYAAASSGRIPPFHIAVLRVVRIHGVETFGDFPVHRVDLPLYYDKILGSKPHCPPFLLHAWCISFRTTGPGLVALQDLDVVHPQLPGQRALHLQRGAGL